MVKYKNKRQEKLLELILSLEVETQEELSELLWNAGFRATQATISRDIKDMGLIKVAGKEKKFRYVPAKSAAVSPKDRFSALMKDGILQVLPAQNIVVVKCHVGMAQAVCAVIDSMNNDNIVGSLAGDDTIFLAVTDISHAERMCAEFRAMIHD